MKKILSIIGFFCVSNSMAQIIEDFSLSEIGASYSSGAFCTNSSICWHYVNARGNQQTTENKNKAISFSKAADACLYSDTIPYGISQLSFQYEQALSSNCDASVYINDSLVGTITTYDQKGVTNIFSFSSDNYQEAAVVKIRQNNASSGQLTIDDIRITYAKTPFMATGMNCSEHEFIVSFSHKLSDGSVRSLPYNCIDSQEIKDGEIHCKLIPGLCGKIIFFIENCRDTADRLCNDTMYTHTFFSPIERGMLTITEIMADPSPSVGLPEYEYIEVCNLSNCLIQCNELTIFIGATKLASFDKELAPGEHLCIAPTKMQDYITDSSHIVFIKNFPSIANDGDVLALYSGTEIIASVPFSKSWYQDYFKENGGWALEKKDFTNMSEVAENWGASIDKRGGTPGAVNAIATTVADVTKPEILSIHVINDSTIDIAFSENLVLTETNCEIPTRKIQLIIPQNNSLSNWRIITSDPLIRDTEYTFYCKGTDFADNPFERQETIFAHTDSILMRNTFIINEILFNPKTGHSDFIELYNNSESYYDASELFLSNGDDYVQISSAFTLIPPHSYIVVSPEADILQTNANCDALFFTAPLPTFPDEEGTVMILNKWGECIDSVQYSETWHSDFLDDTEGVSLERMDFSAVATQKTSWFSASESSGFATPGCRNSHYRSNTSDKNIQIASESVSPDGDGEDDELIIYCHDIPEGTFCTVRIFTSHGRFVSQIANNQLLATEDCLRWNCTDISGRLVPRGVYIVQIEGKLQGKKGWSLRKDIAVLRK